MTLHTIVLLVAMAGSTVPVRTSGVLAVAAVGTSVILLTGMKSGALTTILKLAIKSPAAVPLAIVAVIVTIPGAVVSIMLPSIVAPVVPAFKTLHTIVLFVAVKGEITPERISGVPAVARVGTPDMPVTGTRQKAHMQGLPLVALPLIVPPLWVTVPPTTVLITAVPFIIVKSPGMTVADNTPPSKIVPPLYEFKPVRSSVPLSPTAREPKPEIRAEIVRVILSNTIPCAAPKTTVPVRLSPFVVIVIEWGVVDSRYVFSSAAVAAVTATGLAPALSGVNPTATATARIMDRIFFFISFLLFYLSSMHTISVNKRLSV
jgi:hypothetical protein